MHCRLHGGGRQRVRHHHDGRGIAPRAKGREPAATTRPSSAGPTAGRGPEHDDLPRDLVVAREVRRVGSRATTHHRHLLEIAAFVAARLDTEPLQLTCDVRRGLEMTVGSGLATLH
jgi:hypothetical protein